MGLKLQEVAARQGWTWVRDGARLFAHRPLAFCSLLLVFLLVSLVWITLPVVSVLALAAAPLLSLGFMVAARSVLRGGPAHPGQLIQPLMSSSVHRRRLLVLCGLYGLGAVAAALIAVWVVGPEAMHTLLEAMAQPDPSGAKIVLAAADPRIARGQLVLALLAGALSVPFWHAPALVLWGDQGVWQSLFSSTLALWRARAAYLVYGLAWTAASLLLGAISGVVAGVFGLQILGAALALPALLATLAAFYVSLWFSFVDCFGMPDDGTPAADHANGSNGLGQG